MSNDMALWLSIVAGIAAIAYGGISTRWILKQAAGNDRMQEIAAAIQEGAEGLYGSAVRDDRHRRCRAVCRARLRP